MNKGTIGIIVVIIVLAGGLIAYSAYKNHQTSGSNDVSYTGDMNTNDPTLGADAMVGGDGSGSPGTIIQSINMPQDGFIVIEQDNNGQPGAVLGKSDALHQGANESVKISTQTELKPGTSYFVSLYSDTNKNGMYEQGMDTVMMDKDGKPIQQTFTAPDVAGTGSNTNPSPDQSGGTQSQGTGY